jgi:hypothetical protein
MAGVVLGGVVGGRIGAGRGCRPVDYSRATTREVRGLACGHVPPQWMLAGGVDVACMRCSPPSLGLTLIIGCYRERYRRVPVTRARTGNGIARTGRNRGRTGWCVHARPVRAGSWECYRLTAALRGTPRVIAPARPLPAAPGAGPVASVASPPSRPSRAEGSRSPAVSRAVPPRQNGPAHRPFRNGHQEHGLFRRTRGTAPERSAVPGQWPGTRGTARPFRAAPQTPGGRVRSAGAGGNRAPMRRAA